MKIDFLQLLLHLLKISKHYRLQPYMFCYKILNLWILFQPLILNIQTLWIKTLGVWLYDLKALDHLVSNLERSLYYIIHKHQRTHYILFYFAYTLNTLLLSLRASENPYIYTYKGSPLFYFAYTLDMALLSVRASKLKKKGRVNIFGIHAGHAPFERQSFQIKKNGIVYFRHTQCTW